MSFPLQVGYASEVTQEETVKSETFHYLAFPTFLEQQQ
jgi:hypothetical protein